MSSIISARGQWGTGCAYLPGFLALCASSLVVRGREGGTWPCAPGATVDAVLCHLKFLNVFLFTFGIKHQEVGAASLKPLGGDGRSQPVPRGLLPLAGEQMAPRDLFQG